MDHIHRRRAGVKVSLALLLVFGLLILLASAVSSLMPGDVNSDGVVDIRDLVLVQRHILGFQPPLTAVQLTAADVNGDGIINVVDVNLGMQFVQGHIISFPTRQLHAPVLIAPVEGASVEGSMISFQWGAVAGATRYQLEISKVSDGTLFRTVDLGNFTSTTQFAFANDGTQYRWRVRAGNALAWGAWSGSRTFTNGVALPAPTLGSPAHNAALDRESISFQWSAVAGATRYQLEVIRVSDSFVFKNIELGNITSALQSGFPNNGTEFRWRVRAGNAHAWGAWSGSRTFTSGVTLPAPMLSSPAHNSAITDAAVLFRWNEVAGATRYQLEVLRGTEGVPFKDVTLGNITTSEQFGFLRDGTQYRWRVRAGNNTGWGAWSGYFTLTSGRIPAAPTLNAPTDKAVIVGTQISFQWSAVAGATNYELEIVDTRTGALVTKTAVGNTTSSMQRGFDDDGATYRWRVRAAIAEAWGPWSGYREFTNGNRPVGPVLTYPHNNENISGDRITFEWNPVPGADRYELLIEYDVAGRTVFRRVTLGNVFATRQAGFPNDGSVFRWSVRSGNANNWGEFTTPFRTFTNGLPFGSPLLQTPAAFSTQSGTPITFRWDPLVNATRYNLEIVDVRTSVASVYSLDNPTATIAFSNDGSEFKWRVRAGDSARWGTWSAYRHFINEPIISGVPAAPSLLSPAINATAATETIDFAWTISAGANRYNIQVVRVSGGAVVVNNEAIRAPLPTSQTVRHPQPGFPNDGSEYLWRVRARNATGWGPWSFYRQFTNGAWWILPGR